MKSHALPSVVTGLYENLIRDFQYIDPTISEELHSVKRVQRLLESRGLAVFTIAMPDIAKFLEKGLRNGVLSDDRPPLAGRKSDTDVRPQFLYRFWCRIFDEDGLLLPSPCTDAIAGLRQLLLFAKKLRLECSEERTRDALREFVEVDESLPRSHPDTWDSDTPQWVRRTGHPLWGSVSQDQRDHACLFEGISFGPTHPMWEKFDRVSRFVMASFGEAMAFDELRPKHGPGAVADDVPIKYVLPHWPDKLAQIFPPDWFASHDFVDRTISNREFPSRVLCVPKTQKGPRIIAAEPTAHQWCQGAVQRWLTDAVARSLIRHSISFTDQTLSQRKALEASITGSFATVDLSSASDRLSTRLVEYVFQSRRDVLDALHATRTRTFRMPDGSIHIARKFACMGSACTFPVQTIVFTIAAITSCAFNAPLEEITPRWVEKCSSDVRVFGDDIILPTSAYGPLVWLLTELGLRVNTDKSHGSGLFREACGLDAYSGVDVTPAYWLEPYDLRKPESLVSVVASANNFHRKGLWKAAAFLLNTVDPKVRKLLRMATRDVSQPCIFSYAPSEHYLKFRFNPDTQVHEVRSLVLDVKVERQVPGWEAQLLQFFSERGSKPLLEEVLEFRGPERALGQAGRPKARLNLRWVLAEDRGST